MTFHVTIYRLFLIQTLRHSLTLYFLPLSFPVLVFLPMPLSIMVLAIYCLGIDIFIVTVLVLPRYLLSW